MGSDISEHLRNGEQPIIARVDQGRTILDLRTVDPADDPTVTAALASAVNSLRSSS